MTDLIFTDGQDKRFLSLCAQLDSHLNEFEGGAALQAQYIPLNQTGSVHNVALLLENGQAAACGGYKHYAPGTAEIKRVFTRSEYRERGYAKAIMAALEDRARSQGYTRLILETGRVLEAAIRLYAALGFSTIPNYGPYRRMPDSVCMEKRLTNAPKTKIP